MLVWASTPAAMWSFSCLSSNHCPRSQARSIILRSFGREQCCVEGDPLNPRRHAGGGHTLLCTRRNSRRSRQPL
jgi:hypothetical protein